MTLWQEKWLDKFYRDQQDWIDGTTQFCDILGIYAEGKSVLEVGPGSRGSKTTHYMKEISSNLERLDIDPNVLKNPFIKAAHVYDGTTFPFPDQSFDVVVSDYVNEHIANPYEHHHEINRVLRNGGYYLFRTPNKFHYISIVGSLTPHWLHRIVSRWLRRLPEEAHDLHPTRYLFNSKKTCKEILVATGLEIIEMELTEKEPSYGMNSRTLFLVFMGYERVVNSTEFFSGLRVNILCVARKKDIS